MSYAGPVIMICVAVLVGIGIWRATAAQKGGGCPYCQRGESHDHEADGHSHE